LNALWITLALVTAGFVGWPVTALVFRLARTIDDKADAARGSEGVSSADDPSADVTVDGEITVAAGTASEDTSKSGPAAPSDAAPPGGPAPAGGQAAPTTRILRGGAIIGVLERLAVCLAILAGQPITIAYVVAIKGLGRFAELKETPVAAERFIIGTLASMLWAAGVAALTRILVLG
jgi:hypothetical protein